MEDSEGKLRVFISYSHVDDGAAASIAQALTDNGLVPLSDAGFPYGTGFVEQIRSFIAHAHVFLPLVTESSSSRGWVHQEIGYAIAMNIPVLPVVVGEALPQAMMQQLRAVKLGESLEDLRSQLSLPLFRDLVDRYRDPSFATFECAPSIEQRAAMFVKYSQELREMRVTGRVRQKGGLSSFHMPDKRVAHELWRTRYGSIPPTHHQRQLLLDELAALKGHASASGCTLIVDPYIPYEEYGVAARKVRLQCLIDFLTASDVSDVQIAVYPQMPGGESVTVVGSYFCAQSVSGTIGHYRQTIFTRHAPSMNQTIDRFDKEFAELLDESGWTPGNSRERAISLICDEVAKL